MSPSLRRFSPDFVILAVAPTGRVSDSPSPPPQASSRGHGRLASPHTETSPYAALGICVYEVNSVRVSCALLLCPPSPPVLLLHFPLSYTPTAAQPHSHSHTATQPHRHTTAPPGSNATAYPARQASALRTCPLSYLPVVALLVAAFRRLLRSLTLSLHIPSLSVSARALSLFPIVPRSALAPPPSSIAFSGSLLPRIPILSHCAAFF